MPKDTTFAKISTHMVTYNEDAWPMDVIAFLEPSPNWPASIGVLLSIEQNGHGSEDVGICRVARTADRIASALHVAAAHVRAARGEQVEAAPTPALFFDKDGCGPSYTALVVTNLRGLEGKIPDSLGLRIVADPRGPGLVFTDALDGGFMMDRASAADLHARIGAWLAAHEAGK